MYIKNAGFDQIIWNTFTLKGYVSVSFFSFNSFKTTYIGCSNSIILFKKIKSKNNKNIYIKKNYPQISINYL